MRINDTGVTLFEQGVAVYAVKEGTAVRNEYNAEQDANVMAEKLRSEGKQDVSVEQVRAGEQVTRGLCLLGDPFLKVNVVVEGVFTADDRQEKLDEGYVEPFS